MRLLFYPPRPDIADQAGHVGFVPILLQKSKIEQPKNLAKVDLWTSLLPETLLSRAPLT
jgi:hypothetical protein